MLALMTYNVSTLLLLLILMAALWTDVRHHRIPNVLSFGAIILGLGLQAWAFGADGILNGLGGLGVGLVILLPFYLLGGMGAGDVKLMAAIGTFLGPADAGIAAGLTLIAGSVLGVLVLLIHGGALATMHRYGSTLKSLILTRTWNYEPPKPGDAAAARFPYGLAIASGTVGALWWLSELDWGWYVLAMGGWL
jgi:prepilin peptidase CpaA